MTTSSTSAAVDSSTSISTTDLSVVGGSDNMATSTMSQPSALPQGLVPGASQSRPSSDNATSNSVINPSSSGATGAQSSDTQWLDSAVRDWDKQSGSSQPNTPRLDHSNNPVTTSQFTGWGSQPFSSTFSGGDAAASTSSNKWGAGPTSNNNNNSNMQTAWGSQSPSLSSQQQPSTTSDWGMPTGSTATAQWGMPSTPVTQAEPDSWGQPKLLPNAGTDGWGPTAAPPPGQTSTPSSAPNAQLSQWGQPTSHTSSSSAWQSTPTNMSSASNQPVPSTVANTSASTVQQAQWGATTSAGQLSNPVSPPTTTVTSTQEPGAASAAPTSWAGAAAKGLPKPQPKPQEPVDPVKAVMEQSINNPDGWGRLPVRQDTSWGKPPDKNKQDESNQWHSTQNNGTAIWEAAKSSTSGQAPADKSTWNQKVVGNNDPNVWNGEGSKGKDNALWDDVPSSKEPDTADQANTWNSQGQQSRTISGSSGGAGEGNPDAGWSGNTGSANRSSPPNSINQQPTTMGAAGDSSWSSQNGSAEPRKLNRWDSNPAQGPVRMNSMTAETDCDTGVGTNSPVVDMVLQQGRLVSSQSQSAVSAAVGVQLPSSQSSNTAALVMQSATSGRGYWDQGQNRPNGPANNWNSKPSTSWSGDNVGPGGHSWGPSQSNPAAGHGSWGDGPNNTWQSGGGSNRKPSFTWDESQVNGGGDFSRDRRGMKNDGDGGGDDADMGDWNESNSVWSSAAGFKQPRKHSSIPENHMAQQHMQPSRIGGAGGHFNNSMPAMMNAAHGGNMGANANMGTKQQMLQYLVTQLKFPKDEAHSALINNNMNMEAAIADLNKSSSMQQQMGGRGDFGAMTSGPIGDNAFNPNIPPPNMPTNALNTPFTNNAQHNQSAVQGSSRINKPNQPRVPIGRGGSNPQASQQQQQQQHQQTALAKQLEMGVQMNNIHPHMLHLPLVESNLRIIQQLLTLQQSYQHQHDLLIQAQRRHGSNSPQVESVSRVLSNINGQMKVIQQPLLHKLPPNQMGGKYPGGGLTESLSNMTLSGNPNQTGTQASSSQSRLGLWTDKAPGSRQGASNMPSSSLHASHSTPNLQGGMLGDNNPWSSSGSSSGMWSNMNPSGQYLDNQNESHSGTASNGPHPIPANSSQSFDIPEFVPGVPWQGANSNKVEDDPNITPGSVARSLSVSTTSALNGSGHHSADLGWSNNAPSNSKSTWTSQNPVSPAVDMWTKGTRPPPGFNKNINRSMSMPQGPSEKTSAFSPVGAAVGWDNQQSLGTGGGSPWLLLRNLPMQVDGNTLKTLCSQHGPLQSFFVNTNSGQALIRYTTKEEALKAQKSLNSCPMFETTITAEFVDESEVQRIIEQCQRQGSLGRSHSVSAAPGAAMWPNTNNNSGSSSNLWGGSSNMPATAGASVSTWGGGSGGFLQAADVGGNNYAM